MLKIERPRDTFQHENFSPQFSLNKSNYTINTKRWIISILHTEGIWINNKRMSTNKKSKNEYTIRGVHMCTIRGVHMSTIEGV